MVTMVTGNLSQQKATKQLKKTTTTPATAIISESTATEATTKTTTTNQNQNQVQQAGPAIQTGLDPD